MNSKAVTRVLVLLPSLAAASIAGAQVVTTTTKQVLDTVAVFGGTDVYGIDYSVEGNPAANELGASSAVALRACKLTSNQGLFCIDANKNVVRWSNPAVPTGETLFNCADISELDGKSEETCTAITLDPAGNIWLAGKNKGKTHSLLRLRSCPNSGDVGAADDSFCIDLWATGRPLLLDIEYIGGDAAQAFPYGKGVLGLQERKTVVFFRDRTDRKVEELGSGKSGWGLAGSEQLQGVTLLQPISQTTEDFVLVTTSSGRVVARSVQTPGHRELYNLADPTCTSRTPQYGIRASAKSESVYVTDRDCGTLVSFASSVDTGGLTLAVVETVGATEGLDTAPEGPTIAAGIGIDMAACSGECEATPGAYLRVSADNLAGGKSGLTLFQVKGLPDCRWPPASALAACAGKPVIGVAVTDGSCDVGSESGNPGLPANCLSEALRLREPSALDGVLERAQQYLNVTPLLPLEITDLFPDGLPAIMISPHYWASEEDRIFEAFFGIPEEGVTFTGTIDGRYQLEQLIEGRTDTFCEPPMPGDDYVDLLEWDVATRVSERYVGVDGLFVDTLVNDGCGSLKTKSPGWSMVSYGLGVMPHPVVLDNDAVFARLLETLGNELVYVVEELACKPVDTGGPVAPITDCSTLGSAMLNTVDKLDKCIVATYQPKQSASNQNCQSFLSQLGGFKEALASAASACPEDRASCDPANRLGEIEARTATLEYVYHDKFAPSVPDGGFCRESDTCTP